MLYGAIIGDIVGSKYEFNNIQTKDFVFFDKDMFFTDDTVMTIAIAEALSNTYKNNYDNLGKEVIKQMKKYGKLYPHVGYGGRFKLWLKAKKPLSYNSFGNGSAMRVSAVPYFAKSLNEVKILSKAVSEVTHNHYEGIKGAEAIAVAIYMALNKASKKLIKKYIEKNYYSMNYDYNDLKENYKFEDTCQNTVPQALYCFFISESFEDAIRTGISIGGDSDTLCAIIGSIAEAYYGIDESIKKTALSYLDNRLYNQVIKLNQHIFSKTNKR